VLFNFGIQVKFNTSKTDRWETDARRCHVNYVILESDWEAEFCRVAESHPRVKAYVKNHNLGFEVPYRYGSENRKYRPDFVVLVDDGHGEADPLHLVVEIKGYGNPLKSTSLFLSLSVIAQFDVQSSVITYVMLLLLG